jgi:hypothetical protein
MISVAACSFGLVRPCSWYRKLEHHGFDGKKLNPAAGASLRRAIFQEIGETDHVDPEGNDEGGAGLPVAWERPGAGECH